MYRKIIPNVVSATDVCTITKEATAYDAAKAMADKNIAAIIIVDDQGKIGGILTERDLARKVTALGLDSKTVIAADIMTANPDTLTPDDSAGDALELMNSRR